MGFEARLAGKERGDATDAKGLYDHKDKGGIEHGLTDRQGLKTAAKRLRTWNSQKSRNFTHICVILLQIVQYEAASRQFLAPACP